MIRKLRNGGNTADASLLIVLINIDVITGCQRRRVDWLQYAPQAF